MENKSKIIIWTNGKDRKIESFYGSDQEAKDYAERKAKETKEVYKIQ